MKAKPEFAHTTNPPIVQDLQKILRWLQCLNRQATGESPRIVNDRGRLGSPGRQEGEVRRGGDTHLGEQPLGAKQRDLLIGQLLPASFLSDTAKISQARPVAAQLDFRRKRQGCLNEDLMKAFFLRGRT